MKLPPFKLERFYARHEFTTRFMLSSSDCESWSVSDLLALEPAAHDELLGQRMGYTESPGSPELRSAIAALYKRVEPDDVIVASCAEEAILLVYHALIDAGDHAIVESPCYQSALELARSTGAAVSTWERRFQDGWLHDLEAFERLLRPQTRIVYINQPHNPTGTLMTPTTFRSLAELAREHSFVLFSDEVFRGLEHDASDRLPAACDLDERAISLGSISKTYGLPGLRIGWIVSRDPAVRNAILTLKDYTTICASAPSEFLTALALRHERVLIDRNLGIVKQNLARLNAFFDRRRELFEWIPPTASPIGFPLLKGVADVDDFCDRLARAGVLLLPGSVYGEPDHVRVGFGRANMPAALQRLEERLESPLVA